MKITHIWLFAICLSSAHAQVNEKALDSITGFHTLHFCTLFSEIRPRLIHPNYPIENFSSWGPHDIVFLKDEEKSWGGLVVSKVAVAFVEGCLQYIVFNADETREESSIYGPKSLAVRKALVDKYGFPELATKETLGEWLAGKLEGLQTFVWQDKHIKMSVASTLMGGRYSYDIIYESLDIRTKEEERKKLEERQMRGEAEKKVEDTKEKNLGRTSCQSRGG